MPWLAENGLSPVFSGHSSRIWEDDKALPRAYLARTVEVLPSEQVLERLGSPKDEDIDLVVLEASEGPSTIETPSGPGRAAITEQSHDSVRIEVQTQEPATLVLLDAWSPEWHATIDGRAVPTRRANLVGRAVAVPAGAHTVDFRFAPVSLYLGASVSLATISGLLLAAVLVRRRHRR